MEMQNASSRVSCEFAELSLSDMLEVLREIGPLMTDIIRSNPETVDTLEPEDVLALSCSTVNELIDCGDILKIGEARDMLNVGSVQTVRDAMKYRDTALKYVQIGGKDGGRFFFTARWVDDRYKVRRK